MVVTVCESSPAQPVSIVVMCTYDFSETCYGSIEYRGCDLNQEIKPLAHIMSFEAKDALRFEG
eukprot:924769-Amphidinium_carterae.1